MSLLRSLSRPAVIALLLALSPRAMHAADASCSAPTLRGGGPAATDCIVTWGGILGLVAICPDGDSSCDLDGAADGTCTFGLQAFANVTPCAPGPLLTVSVKPTSSAVAQALAAALHTLEAGTGCTTPGLAVPLRVSLAGIKPGTAKLSVSANAGGKPDRDKLRLTCLPSTTPPSFAAVQAIFTGRCAIAGCHNAVSSQVSAGLDLHEGVAYANLIGVRATESPLALVTVGNTKRSYLARKILGQGLPRFSPTRMPTGSGPLPDEELFTILSWIKNGAPGS